MIIMIGLKKRQLDNSVIKNMNVPIRNKLRSLACKPCVFSKS